MSATQGSPRLLGLAVGVLLAGCMASVRVAHRVAPDRLGQANAGRTARVYILVQARPSKLEEAPGLVKGLVQALQLASKDNDAAYSRDLTPAEREALGRGAAALFADAGSHAAYQVVYGDEPPAALKDFAPTASLWIYPSDPSARQSAFEVKVSSTRKKTRFRVEARHSLRWRLQSEPERTPLAQGTAGEGDSASERDSRWAELDPAIKERVKRTREEFLASLHTDLLPHTVHRTRIMAKKKGLHAEAYKKFKKDDWDGAAALWRQAVEKDPADSVAHHHLGVYFERQGRWDDARAEYRLTREPDGPQALAQLDELYTPGTVAASTAPFLAERVAVLPFENESVDVDAPALARKKVQRALLSWGYNLMPMEEVDEKLRGIGITDGGQLRMTLEGALAQALGAERLVFGTVEEFRVVDVGVYARRQVKLSFRITDSSGATVWENRGQTLDQDVTEGKDAGKEFITRLAVRQLEKTAKTYLKEETDRAVALALEPLPRYLPPKK